MKRSTKPPAAGSATAPDIAKPAGPAEGQAVAGAGAGAGADAATAPADGADQQQGSDPADRAQRIREAAYARWQQRGDAPGDADGDWAAAEDALARTDPAPSTRKP